ncbi:hypothetical protein ASZ78_000619 [Callipepla squamata]|uniref:G-protein coupled receptors family 2 profile 2 domain-containing protein n=1 Tax=Callipepla squamata TaxID=9009 RepID=A0A226MU88_CALSU|nr:hypothetical protein ASZ78_000619 [Callipepla squamata]
MGVRRGLPALVVAISIGFTKTKGYGTAHYCWLSLEGGLLYAFVGPAAAVVLVNMVIGILVFNKLVSRDGILDKKLKHRAGASLWSSCVVLPLLALTWMSAVLAMTDKRSILFQILFAVFDSLQGFVIVMVHCILRRETDFEKDVDIACRSVLHKDIGPCRAATITGTLSRISLNDEEEEKGPNPEGMSYSTLPGNIISKVIIQQPTGLHMPMSMSELANQCLKKDNSELRRTVYLCTDDNLRGADMDIVHPQERMIESDYIVMPRSSVNTQPSLKDESKINIGMDTLPHERLLHYKVNPEFNMNPSVMDQFNINLDQHLPTQEHMQSLPFEPRTAVKNFIASELDDNAGLSRSETGSTISMSSLEKVMHTRKRHMELFQELNQKFQTLDRFRDVPKSGSMENSAPNKAPWDNFKTTGEYQHYTTINVLDTEAKDALELRPAEWEKCLNLPLDVQEVLLGFKSFPVSVPVSLSHSPLSRQSSVLYGDCVTIMAVVILGYREHASNPSERSKTLAMALISNGNLPNWGKVNESESQVSVMKLMVKKRLDYSQKEIVIDIYSNLGPFGIDLLMATPDFSCTERCKFPPEAAGIAFTSPSMFRQYLRIPEE